jgi:hypothetical protein
MEPFDILISKAGKKYDSKGSPIDLVLHYQKQAAPWQQYFDEMVDKYSGEVNMRRARLLFGFDRFSGIGLSSKIVPAFTENCLRHARQVHIWRIVR